MKTRKLNNGIEVLARDYNGTLEAVTYSNRTQANRKAAELGVAWTVWQGTGRPFYVALACQFKGV